MGEDRISGSAWLPHDTPPAEAPLSELPEAFLEPTAELSSDELRVLLDHSDLTGRLRAWEQIHGSDSALARDLRMAVSAIELSYREAEASRSKRSVLRPTSSLVRLRTVWDDTTPEGFRDEAAVLDALSAFMFEEMTPRPLRAEIYDHDIKLVGVMVEPGPLPHRWFWRVRHTANNEIMDSGEPYSSARARDHALEVLFPDLTPVQVDR